MENTPHLFLPGVWGDSTAASVAIIKDALVSTTVQKLWVLQAEASRTTNLKPLLQSLSTD